MIGDIVEVMAILAQSAKKDYKTGKKVNLKITKKYNKQVIAAAYSWIYEKVTRDYVSDLDKKDPSTSFRMLSDEELHNIGEENLNYLLHFYNIGLLNNNDLELIIEQLMFFEEDEINTENINVLILGLFLDIDAQTLPGSRLLLYSSDTIN